MVWNYEVCQLRDTGYSVSANNSGGQRSCKATLRKKFIVIVTDPSDPNFHGSQVNDIHAAAAKDSVTNLRVPQVNYDTYYDSITNVVVPLAVCSSKTVTRKKENTAVFEVDCTFETGGGPNVGLMGMKEGPVQEFESPEDPEPQKPPRNTSDISPVVSRGVVGRDNVLYSAQAFGSDGLGGDLSLGARPTHLLPLKMPQLVVAFQLPNEINQPITRKQPLLQITITQFEEVFQDEDLLDRCFKVNSQEYRGFPVKSAMITAINSVKQIVYVDVAPAGDPPDVRSATWHRVTYNILIDEYAVTDSSGASLFIGHAQGVPLIGPWYLDENDDARQFLVGEETGIGNVGLINIDGYALGGAAPGFAVNGSQDGPPDYVRFDTVKEIDFEDFMQA